VQAASYTEEEPQQFIRMEDTSQRGRERSQKQEVSFSDFRVFCEWAPEGTPKHEGDEGELHATSATEKGSAKVKGNGINSAEWSPATTSESWINLGSNVNMSMTKKHATFMKNKPETWKWVY